MKIIYFLSILFFTQALFANNEPNFTVKASYFVDANSNYSLHQLQKLKFTTFKNNSLNIGYNKNATVWCCFKIKNNNPKLEQKTWLCFDNNHIDSLILYNNGLTHTLGDRTKYASPFITTQAFELEVKPNQTKVVYVKVKKLISFLEFSFRLANEHDLLQKSRVKIASISFFLGMAFLLIIFNAILFFLTKNKIYLYYIIYSVLSAIYVAISTYYAKYFLLTQFLFFSEGRIYVATLWFISLSTFLAKFLDFKKHQRIKHKIISYCNTLNMAIVIISFSLLVINKTFVIKELFLAGYFSFFVIIITLLWAAFSHLNTNRKKALYVLITFTPQLIWSLCIILKSFKIVQERVYEDWLVTICIYEVFLFGYVLTQNYIATFVKNNQLNKAIILQNESTLQTITQTQIRERRNIANLLHDNLGSKIAHIGQLLQLNNLMLANQSINQLADNIREISHQILPKALDDGALKASLQSQISSLNTSSNETKITFISYDFPDKINKVWVYDMYLISLEIINNAIKHGKSTRVQIEFYKYAKYCVFQYTDNGKGFNTQTTPKGFGLQNIEKRILNYKGIFEINSSPKQGTVVQINIPFKT